MTLTLYKKTTFWKNEMGTNLEMDNNGPLNPIEQKFYLSNIKTTTRYTTDALVYTFASKAQFGE
jgi:hypothetical protein